MAEMTSPERQLEEQLLAKLCELKYEHHPDIRAGLDRFKADKAARELAKLSAKHSLPTAALQGFVDTILTRKIFDGERLTELLAPLDLGWRARTQKELALMTDLVPLLKKRAAGCEISGLKAYED